jgi:glutamate 5-kinase
MHPARAALQKAQRIVVKVGSRSVAGDDALVPALARQIAAHSSERRSFVVVTSGAIALGWSRLGYRRRPKEMPKLQASAAAGQSVLMQRYAEAFRTEGLVAAQVLLTHADLADRERVNNARQALAALIEAGAVPVINENDTVATDEIRFGDNDQLASMVTPLVSADLLLLLTDVEGVLDEKGERIAVMNEAAKIGQVASSGPGTGGMTSKLDAATKASRAGASVVIAPALRADVIADVVAGKDVGTLVLPGSTGSCTRSARGVRFSSTTARLARSRSARAACSPWGCSASAATFTPETPCGSSPRPARRSGAGSRVFHPSTSRARPARRARISTRCSAATAATK